MKISWFAAFCLLLSMQSCYVLEQGVGQIKLRLEQVPIDEAIEAEQNPSYKNLLQAVPQIKRFSENQLKLKTSQNYTSYYSTTEEGVSFVVTACPKDKLVAYTWWFPIVGSVPYKGYFRKEDALELEAELKEKGLDTYMFAAPAYSTLGWFKDPVTTPMLRRGHYSLASTIIHEMVHATLYVKNQGDFNEQLASFVAKKGARDYFEGKGLLTSQLIQQIEQRQERKRVNAKIFIQTYESLKELYGSNVGSEEILRKREIIFNDLEADLNELYPKKKHGYWKFNNARLLQFIRYREDSEILKQYWAESNQNWDQFWVLVRKHIRDNGWES